jgi:hypothetical protein
VAHTTVDKDARAIYLVALADHPPQRFKHVSQLGAGKRVSGLQPTAIEVTGDLRLNAQSAPVKRYTAYLNARQDEVLARRRQAWPATVDEVSL